MPARGRNRESLTPARLERALEHEQRTALTACVSGGYDLPLHRARDALVSECRRRLTKRDDEDQAASCRRAVRELYSGSNAPTWHTDRNQAA